MRRLRLALPAALTVLAVFAAGAAAGDNDSGFQTSAPSMLTPLPAGSSATAIINVGESLPGGYRFEAIPDGLAFKTRGQGRVDLWVNHETSLVPFPLPAAAVAGRSDFTNALVSRLTLNQHSAGLLHGTYVIPNGANYQRFCSSFLATQEHSFERDLLLTNEEASDAVNRTGTAWPAGPNAEDAGVVVAVDVKSGEYRSIYGMGRHNHENSVAIPGFGHPVVLSGDDTFNAPSSQVYLYEASSAAAVWNDTGSLYALRSKTAAVNDYGDLAPGSSVKVEFISVPPGVAKGTNFAKGQEQDGLEAWSNANNVFQFIRIEDIAYDKNDSRVVYMADTGEPRAIPDAATGRLRRGAGGAPPTGTQGPYPNGRIFKLVLDSGNPTAGNRREGTLSVLVSFDGPAATPAYGVANTVHQPDNLETTKSGYLLIQEDTGGHNQSGPGPYPNGFPTATNARIWSYNLATGALNVVAEVDQSSAPASLNLRRGAWESSGIVDASSAFGPGAFLVDVQAHGWEIERSPEPPVPNQVNLMREAGQLLLLRLPGY